AVIGEQIVKNMKIPSLRILTFSGQRFPKIDLTKLPYKVFNAYGNTECGAATIKEMKYTDKKITIGKPEYRMNALVLGEQNEALAEGEVGELFIYGPKVERGYYFNSDDTSKTFINVESTKKKEKARGYCMEGLEQILPACKY
ncbi:AMP-binding protein, partial [Enterococcus faecium]|uniref:AMP-binding protein n=1 Tax=Enterococcus faecium TaxID=1352 RepID=UPI00217CDF64